ncbi:MAG: hypothetical protein WDN23_01565 [Edaphobacter sp.]
MIDFRNAKTATKLGVSVYACAADVKRDNRERCTLQDYQENPTLLQYRLPQSGKWKVLVYQTGVSVAVKAATVHVGVIQVSKADGTVTPIGELDSNASVTRLVDLNVPAVVGSGKPVVITEVYDLAQDEAEASTLKLNHRFNAEKLRPVVLGKAIQALP